VNFLSPWALSVLPLTHPVADPEVDLFAGMKKKKKKQVALDVEETVPEVAESVPAPAAAPAPTPAPVPAAAAPAAVEEKADSGVATPVEGEAGVPAEEGADLFADLKKKKKKKKELPLDLVGAFTTTHDERFG
jgi:translation initiation factor 2 subunit 2